MSLSITGISFGLRIALLAGTAIAITQCSPLSMPPPTLDIRDEQHLQLSLQQLEEALPPERRIVFEQALQTLITALTLEDVNRWGNSTAAAPSLLSLQQLNGLTAEDIIAKAKL